MKQIPELLDVAITEQPRRIEITNIELISDAIEDAEERNKSFLKTIQKVPEEDAQIEAGKQELEKALLLGGGRIVTTAIALTYQQIRDAKPTSSLFQELMEIRIAHAINMELALSNGIPLADLVHINYIIDLIGPGPSTTVFNQMQGEEKIPLNLTPGMIEAIRRLTRGVIPQE